MAERACLLDDKHAHACLAQALIPDIIKSEGSNLLIESACWYCHLLLCCPDLSQNLAPQQSLQQAGFSGSAVNRPRA